jgi:hypothetical protein
MASLMKKVSSFLTRNMILVIALIVGIIGISLYSNSKGMDMDSMSNNLAYQGESENAEIMEGGDVSPADALDIDPAGPLGTNQDFAQVENVQTGANGLANVNQESQDPKDLLPRDMNSEWAKLNPVGQNDLDDVNLLKAGHHIGINTVGQSLRNANLQLRSDPPVPQVNVGPWNNTTIEGDKNNNRRPLE